MDFKLSFLTTEICVWSLQAASYLAIFSVITDGVRHFTAWNLVKGIEIMTDQFFYSFKLSGRLFIRLKNEKCSLLGFKVRKMMNFKCDLMLSRPYWHQITLCPYSKSDDRLHFIRFSIENQVFESNWTLVIISNLT